MGNGDIMNLHLKRLRDMDTEIYGNLTGDGLNLYTLEPIFLCHPDGVYLPKVPQGIYTCKRGMHQLKHGNPFETFQIMNVPNHNGVLFHVGNTRNDSDGCILLGLELDLERKMLLESAAAFRQFMNAQFDEDGFQLTVEN